MLLVFAVVFEKGAAFLYDAECNESGERGERQVVCPAELEEGSNQHHQRNQRVAHNYGEYEPLLVAEYDWDGSGTAG